MQAPWYFGATQPTLKHQREPTEWKKDYSKMDAWYKKGINEVTASQSNCQLLVITLCKDKSALLSDLYEYGTCAE